MSEHILFYFLSLLFGNFQFSQEIESALKMGWRRGKAQWEEPGFFWLGVKGLDSNPCPVACWLGDSE